MKFGLIGHPTGHSLSPALFKAGYEGKYCYELIESADFETAYDIFLDRFDGINVTSPFKEMAYAKADILSEECKKIKAANILMKTAEGIKAFNSDYLGVRKWLTETVEAYGQMKRVLIAGMGGAGKAAAAAAESLGMDTILMNRTLYDDRIRPLSEFSMHFRDADIIIYCIPDAIRQIDGLTDSDLTSGKPRFILEANYKNPAFEKILLDKMKDGNTGTRYTGGKTWLLYQAVTGYEIFTGEKPSLERMSACL